MYAIIEDSGTQIMVSEGSVIKVDVRDLPDDAETLSFDKVLLVREGDIPGQAEDGSTIEGGALKLGAPYVEGAVVTADILEEGRDDKVEVYKYKRRKGYRRRMGHRQGFIRVKVTKIEA